MQYDKKPEFISMSDIDLRKWNNCILKSANEMVYAYSWYLDVVNNDWEALVYGDYEIVMPLTNSKKYGINYLYQPPFTRQLGIFSRQNINPELVKLFIDAIPNKYKYININLNKYNNIEALKKYKMMPRFSYELDLIESYDKILENYSIKHKQNLITALKNKLSVNQGIAPNEFFKLLETSNNKKRLRSEHINILRQLIAAVIRYKSGYLYGVYNKYNVLTAAAFFVRSRSKMFLILSVENEEAAQNYASIVLINSFIKEFSYKNLTLDFIGIDLANSDEFCKGFGANKFTYNNIIVNRLPFPVNIFNRW